MTERDFRSVLFLACFLSSVAANAYIIAPASVAPLLLDQFDVTRSAAGVAISAAVFGFAFVQLPSGFLMDRYDNRRMIMIGAAVFGPAGVAGVFAPSYELFLVGRFVAGLAGGTVFVLGTNVVSQVFSGARQGLVLTVFIASAPVGFALSQFAGPVLAARFGWAANFLAYPLLALLSIPLFALSWSTPVRAPDPISFPEFKRAVGNRSVLLVGISAFCSYMFYIFFNSWMPTYATESLPLTLSEAGAITSLLPAVGLLARPAGGLVSDALGNRRRPVVVASLLFALPGLAVINYYLSPLSFAVTMLGVGFSIQFGAGVYYVYARELAPEGASGTSLSVFTTIAFTGTLVSPTVGGLLIDAFSWTVAFVAYGGIGCLGVVLLALVPESDPAT
ncbi:MFS transporter [Halorientalis sp.]|uniref:MFS transporter n=1 Tax=Halorientalis sp. TaxID=1931229 RepID=UPI002608FF11|nr:MFS transporter [Halorientalis sp.]